MLRWLKVQQEFSVLGILVRVSLIFSCSTMRNDFLFLDLVSNHENHNIQSRSRPKKSSYDKRVSLRVRKSYFRCFSSLQKRHSSARNENLRPVLKSGLWCGNMVKNLLTFGHLKVVFSLFLISYRAFSHFMYLPEKIQVSQKRKDSTSKCKRQNLFIDVTSFQIWFVCLHVCLSLMFCQFRKRKMVQSWFQKQFWNQNCDVVSNLVAIYNFDLFHSALLDSP